jgi:hypothetical protein
VRNKFVIILLNVLVGCGIIVAAGWMLGLGAGFNTGAATFVAAMIVFNLLRRKRQPVSGNR